MDNQAFLQVISKSFEVYLTTGSRSNSKLKVLHGAIASDLSNRLGEGYTIKSLGYEIGKEGKIDGRYVNKAVDITISNRVKQLGGIGVKYVMNNYSQNSNNYFEGMLGETANIRATEKAYFQILILPETLPYFNNKNIMTKMEKITEHNLNKYLILSKDNVSMYLHTPLKTLIYLIRIPNCPQSIVNKDDYLSYYQNLCLENKLEFSTSTSKHAFGDNVIFNDYKTYINKVIHYIKSI